MTEQLDALDAGDELAHTMAVWRGSSLAWNGKKDTAGIKAVRNLERRTRPRAPGIDGMF